MVISITFEVDTSRASVSYWRISLRASCIPQSYILIINILTTIKGTLAAFNITSSLLSSSFIRTSIYWLAEGDPWSHINPVNSGSRCVPAGCSCRLQDHRDALLVVSSSMQVWGWRKQTPPCLCCVMGPGRSPAGSTARQPAPTAWPAWMGRCWDSTRHTRAQGDLACQSRPGSAGKRHCAKAKGYKKQPVGFLPGKFPSGFKALYSMKEQLAPGLRLPVEAAVSTRSL